jgi:glycerol-3-phosphate dehydrogenase
VGRHPAARGAGNAGDPSSASREHAISTSPRGVLTITGGKLTTYRAMAEQCVDAAIATLGIKARPCDTGTAPLPGHRAADRPDDVRLLPELPWREADVDQAVRAEFAETVADVLMRRTTLAFETADHGRCAAPTVAARLGARLGWTEAGIRHAVEEYAREADRVFGIDP